MSPARNALLVLGLVLALQAAAPAQQPAEERLQATLDTLVPSLLSQYGVPGVALAIVRNGRLEWSQGYGWADIATQRRVGPETRFNLGSTSKSLTAWGVMALAAQGRLDLDQPVNRYLTRWRLQPAEFAAEVSIRRILSHTGGLSVRGYHGVFVPGDRLPDLVRSLEGYEGSDGALRVTQQPGTAFAYSSGGYTLLQLLIEEVSGLGFAEFMRLTLFMPLELRRSGYDWTSELQRVVATPHRETGEPWPHYQFVEQASGGLYTTAADLGRFLAATLRGPAGELPGRGVIPAESLATMLRPAAATQGAYGLGYKFLPVPRGPVLVSHDGANEGWRANFFLNPDTRDAFVLLANSDAGGRMAAPIICAWAATTSFDMSGLCATVRR